MFVLAFVSYCALMAVVVLVYPMLFFVETLHF